MHQGAALLDNEVKQKTCDDPHN